VVCRTKEEEEEEEGSYVLYDFTINIDYLSKLHEQFGLYNGDLVCLLCGRK
jgi:hypothetical protein